MDDRDHDELVATSSKRLRLSRGADGSSYNPATPHQHGASSASSARAVMPSTPAVARALFPDSSPSTYPQQHHHQQQQQVPQQLHPEGTSSSPPLVLMLLDVEEGGGGSFNLFGHTAAAGRQTVCVRVRDFEPHWFIPSPQPSPQEAQQQEGEPYRWPSERLQRLKSLFNMRLPPDCQIKHITEHHGLHPIMYYRPSQAAGTSFLRLCVAPGCSAGRASAAVHAVCKEGSLEPQGFRFPVRQDYEADVRPLTRFLCDHSLSGGGWLYIAGGQYSHVQPRERLSCCDLEVIAPCASLQALTPDATQLADSTWQPQVVQQLQAQLEQGATGSSAESVHSSSLTPLPADVRAGLLASQQGAILPLRILTLDVVLATHDGAARMPVVTAHDPVVAIACELFTARFGHTTHHEQQQQQQAVGGVPSDQQGSNAGSGGAAAAGVAASKRGQQRAAAAGGSARMEVVEVSDSEGEAGRDDAIELDDEGEEEGEGGGAMLVRSGAEGRGPGRSGAASSTSKAALSSGTTDVTEKVVFLLVGPAHGQAAARPSGIAAQGGQAGLQPGSELWVGGARLVLCGSEQELLLQWRQWLVERDPDAIATFQVRDTMGALAARAAAIKLPSAQQHAAMPTAGSTAAATQSPTAPRTPAASRGRAGTASASPMAASSPTAVCMSARPGAEPGLYLSRQLPHFSAPVGIKSVVQYSPQWVKSQSRMSSNSNQETFKVLRMEGRLVFDVLRQVLSHQTLATFTLVDCAQSILKTTLEVMAPQHLAQLWAQMRGTTLPAATPAAASGASAAAAPATPAAAAASGSGSAGAKGQRGKQQQGRGAGRGRSTARGASMSTAAAAPAGAAVAAAGSTAQVQGQSHQEPDAWSPAGAAARLAQYCLQRTSTVRALMQVLATVPETFEMARVTGLSLAEVQYKAQMVRTWSLLLRNARRAGYLVGGRQEAGQLIESPYLMHPLEHNTAGLYTSPVACLDFASLYPSLYRAHNLCYTTLVVNEDVEAVGRDHLTFTPSGHAFTKPSVRQGILPSILAALMTARSRTRETLKTLPPAKTSLAVASARAVLESRQKALKLTANALYGFTGAQASPLQCVPLADSCLALGAQACRTAIQAVTTLHSQGAFGAAGRGARVIYGQTDSLFIHFPNATPAEAVVLGKQASKLVTEGWCVPPMALQYERVCCPFLLLHVNRYAGRSFETEEQAAAGTPTGLLVKGVRSMWRQSAPFVQRVLQMALERIIMQGDVQAAVSHTEEEIRRLLSGRVELWELIMTGGLWRLTGQQVAAAAAGRDAGEQGGNGGGGAPSTVAAGGAGGGGAGAGGGAGGGGDDVRGPHASLAVRLAQRDPGRTFLLGERIQYVLLAGVRLQDEASEEPLLAAELGMPANLELYWKNKLQAPLMEIFDKVLSPSQMQALLSGPHTLVRVDQGMGKGPEADAAAAAVVGVGAAPGPVDARRADTPGKAGGGKGGKQSGLSSFFKQTARCMVCKQALPQAASSSSSSAGAGEDLLPPALCDACDAITGRRAELLCGLLREQAAQQQLLTATSAQCVACHSGGMMGKIVCSNGECNVLYDRLGAARRLGALQVKLQRLGDW